MLPTIIYISFIWVLTTFFVIAGVLSLPLYLLPSVIAAKKRYRIAILTLNLFAGWTIIGWVIALVWSMAASPLSLKGLSNARGLERNKLIKDGPQRKTKNKEASLLAKLPELKTKFSDDRIVKMKCSQ